MGQQSRVEDWICAADVSLLASPREPFGLVLLESMSRAVPVVAADSGGPREILRGEAGVLFKPGDARDLARKLWNVCRDPKLRVQIGHAGRERWRQNYTERHMIDSMLEAYQIAYKTDGPAG